MRTATSLVILASLASLALGANLTDLVEEDVAEQRMILLSVECCDYVKLMPSVVTNDPKNCTGYIINLLNSKKGDGEQECEEECYLDENGLLNKDRSIKDTELRTLLLQQVDPAAKAVMEDALNECFDSHDEATNRDVACNSGADDLVRCIMSEVVSRCPKTLWNVDNPECHDKKEEKNDMVVSVGNR